MNVLLLIAQAFFDHQAKSQTANLKLAGLRAAEMGRRMALAGVCFSLAGLFLFASILVFLIDLGLQIDRGNGIIFSGLMISSLILVLISLFTIASGWLIGRDSKRHTPPPEPAPSPVSELKPLLEAVAVGFLKEFLEQQRQKQTSKRSETKSDNDSASN